MPTARLSQDAKRLVAWTVALLSGAFMLGLTVLIAVLAAMGRPASPGATLTIIACLAMIAFILSGFGVMRVADTRASAAEQTIRDMRRAEERRQYYSGQPTTSKLGQLAEVARWVFEARTPDRLDEQSSKLMAEMIDHCIAGLNQDMLYIIRRERDAEAFGPLENRTGKYGKLMGTDARAEAGKLLTNGMAEHVPGEGEQGRFRWTPLGCAAIGKLGPKLR